MDKDLTKRRTVAFKIDVLPEVFDILMNENNWPKNKRVREFLKDLTPPRTTLNDHMPRNINATSNESTSATPSKASVSNGGSNEQSTEDKLNDEDLMIIDEVMNGKEAPTKNE